MAEPGFERIAALISVPSKMKYLLFKLKRRRFRQHKITVHTKILRELPADVDSRIAHIHRRNEILKANKHSQLKIELDRANASIASLPANQEQNLSRLLVSHRQDLTEAMLANVP